MDVVHYFLKPRFFVSFLNERQSIPGNRQYLKGVNFPSLSDASVVIPSEARTMSVNCSKVIALLMLPLSPLVRIPSSQVWSTSVSLSSSLDFPELIAWKIKLIFEDHNLELFCSNSYEVALRLRSPYKMHSMMLCLVPIITRINAWSQPCTCNLVSAKNG